MYPRVVTDPRWLKSAKWLALLAGISVPIFIFFGLTIGLITGLVVVLAPVYALALQMGIAGIAVSLCLWRRSYVLARAVGLVLVVVPELGFAGWYVRARILCGQAPDPRACLEYLDGSPLLRVLVVVGLLASGLGSVVLWRTVSKAKTQ